MKKLPMCALALLLSLMLTACWTYEPVVEERGFWEVEPDVTVPAEEPMRAASFTLPYLNNQTLDPIACSDGVQQTVGSLLYESLFVLDERFEPQPHLCASYTRSANGLTYTFTLRDDVTFTNGAALTASDVLAAYRRAQVSERYAARFVNVASMRVNRGALVITLKQADSALPALLDIPIVRSGTEKDPVPVGTGPYLFLTDSDGPCLVRNESWWYGVTPPLERIALAAAKDADTAVYLFSAGQAHLLVVDLLAETPASGLGDVDMTDAPTSTLLFLGFNTKTEMLSDSALRVAMNTALDRGAIVTTLLTGHAVAAQFPISPVVPLYPTALEARYDNDSYAEALAALFPEPDADDAPLETTELTLLVNAENPFKTALAEYLSRQLSEAPLTVTPVILPWADYLAALEEGSFDLWLGEVRLTADWDVSSLVGTDGALNYGGYADAATDAALKAFLSDESETTAAALCGRLAEEAPLLPLVFKTTSVLTPEGMVSGLAPTAAQPFAHPELWTVRPPQ